MLIPLKDIICIYEKIIKEINISDLSAIIFTGIDIDSLCTLKILSVKLNFKLEIFQK